MRGSITAAFLLFVLALPFSVEAQVEPLTMSGVVTDGRSRLPIQGVKITIVGDLAKSPATTDSEGSFILTFVQGVEEGTSIRIRIEKSGYKLYDKWIAVSSTIPLQVSLLATKTPLSVHAQQAEAPPLITMQISPSTFPVSVPAHSTISILPLHPYQTLSEAADGLIKYANDCGEEHLWPTQKEIDSKSVNDYEQVLRIEIANHSHETLVTGKMTFRLQYNNWSVGCTPLKSGLTGQKDVVLLPTLDPGKSFNLVAVNQTNLCAWLLPPTVATVKMVGADTEIQIPLKMDRDPLDLSGMPAFSPTKIKWEGVPIKPGGYGIIRSTARCNLDSSAPPLRVTMDHQVAMLRSWIQQTVQRTNANEMWLSQIFQSSLDNIPDGPDVDVPAALRHLDLTGELAILETAPRAYRTSWGETFHEDIRFKVKNLQLASKGSLPQSQTTTTLMPDVREQLDSGKLAMGWTLHKRGDRWSATYIMNTDLLNEPLKAAVAQQNDSTVDADLAERVNALWADIRSRVARSSLCVFWLLVLAFRATTLQKMH
jgi:hypothetical protein